MRTDDNAQTLQPSFLTEAEDFTTSTNPARDAQVALNAGGDIAALASADTNRAATAALRGRLVKQAVTVAPVDQRPHEQRNGDAPLTNDEDVAPPTFVMPAAIAENGDDGHPAMGEVEEQVYYPNQGAGVADEDLAAIRRKLRIEPAVQVEAGRLNLGSGDLASLRAGGVVRVHAPLDAVAWSPLALGREDRVAPALIDQRAAEIVAMGQLKPCRARLRPGGSVELLTGMAEWLAAKKAAEAAGHVGTVVVDLELLDDAQARKLVFADAAEGVRVAPIDLARWARAAVAQTFGTQRKLARALGIDEANVTRLFHVAETVDILAGVITDEWSVSRNQAIKFMDLWSDKAVRPEVKRVVADLPQGSAAKTFSAIFEAFAGVPAKRPGEVEVVGDDDRILGRVRATKAGGIVINLDKEAGIVELPTLVGFVEHALAQVRANAA